MLHPLRCLVALLVWGLASTALAQATDADLARARELYDNGAALYDEGNYEAAILAFRQSYALSKLPELHYNIANCEERLGNLEAARDALNLYRAVAPSAERAALERRIANLETRIATTSATTPAPAPGPAVAAQPVSAQPVSAPASPAPVAEPGRGRGRPLVVGAGGLLVAGGVGLGVASWFGAQSAYDEGDRDAYDRARLLNGVGYGVAGLGAAVAVTGLVLPVKATDALSLSVLPVPAGGRIQLSTSW